MPDPVNDGTVGSGTLGSAPADDATAEELDRLGARHFLDVRATARCMLANLPGTVRSAFAASVAERLLRHDEQLPAAERRRYVATWRPVLDAVWGALAGDRAAHRTAATGVARFYLSPSYLGRRHDDPLDTDDHAIMATVYAAECALHGCLEFATWAGWRGFDAAAVRAAGDPAWPHRRPAGASPYVWELAHPTVQAELDQQLSDLELLAVDDGRVRADGADAGQQLPLLLLDQLRTARTGHLVPH